MQAKFRPLLNKSLPPTLTIEALKLSTSSYFQGLIHYRHYIIVFLGITNFLRCNYVQFLFLLEGQIRDSFWLAAMFDIASKPVTQSRPWNSKIVVLPGSTYDLTASFQSSFHRLLTPVRYFLLTPVRYFLLTPRLVHLKTRALLPFRCD